MKNQIRKVIIRTGDPLSEDQITAALKVSEQTEWWRALIQLIDQTRAEFVASAPTYAGQNNALAMARDVGAHEALTGLMIELQKRSGD